MSRIKVRFLKLPQLIRYGINSCLVTLLDICIVWILYDVFQIDLVIANTIGVVAGFVTDYILSVFCVFQQAKRRGGFSVYLITFFLGLLFADWLIYIGHTELFTGMSENMDFMLSKGISLVIPFFFIYYLRKWLYLLLERQQEAKDKGENNL